MGESLSQRNDPHAVVSPRSREEVRRGLVLLLPRLRRFALSLTASRHDADDLVQTAIERALSRLDQWQPGTRLDSWMYRIVQNLRIDQVRRDKSSPEQIALDEAAAAAHALDDPESGAAMEQVLAAMQRLSEPHRTVLALVCVEGLRYAQAADVLGVSIGTVMSRLSRARKRLQAILDGVDTDGGMA